MNKFDELKKILQDEELNKEYLKFERFCIQNENKFVRKPVKVNKSWYPSEHKILIKNKGE